MPILHSRLLGGGSFRALATGMAITGVTGNFCALSGHELYAPHKWRRRFLDTLPGIDSYSDLIKFGTTLIALRNGSGSPPYLICSISTDQGKTWADVTHGGATQWKWTQIARRPSDGLLVACGQSDLSGDIALGALASSIDSGVTWTFATTIEMEDGSAGSPRQVRGVIYSETLGAFFACGTATVVAGGVIWTSTDGTHWTRALVKDGSGSDPSVLIRSCVFLGIGEAGGLLMAFGYTVFGASKLANAYTSADGIVWDEQFSGGLGIGLANNFHLASDGSGKWLLAGQSFDTVSKSVYMLRLKNDEFASAAITEVDTLSTTHTGFSALRYSAGAFVVVKDDIIRYTTDYGTTWTDEVLPDDRTYRVLGLVLI